MSNLHDTTPTTFDWKISLLWAAIAAAGGTLDWVLWDTDVYYAVFGLNSNAAQPPAFILLALTAPILIFVSIPQTLVLHYFGIARVTWLVATAVGMMLGEVIISAIGDPYAFPFAGVQFFGAISGGCIGIGQWAVLRDRAPKWWIGWIVAGVLAGASLTLEDAYWLAIVGYALFPAVFLGFAAPTISRTIHVHPAARRRLIAPAVLVLGVAVLWFGIEAVKPSSQEFASSIRFAPIPSLTPLLHLVTNVIAPAIMLLLGLVALYCGFALLVLGDLWSDAKRPEVVGAGGD